MLDLLPFTLHTHFHPCTVVGDLPLCRVLLSPRAECPWLILVPRRANAQTLLDLTSEEQAQLWQELVLSQQALLTLPRICHLNVAQIGNKTPQLHLHVVGRYPGDPCWPEPIWSASGMQERSPADTEVLCQSLRSQMQLAPCAPIGCTVPFAT